MPWRFSNTPNETRGFSQNASSHWNVQRPPVTFYLFEKKTNRNISSYWKTDEYFSFLIKSKISADPPFIALYLFQLSFLKWLPDSGPVQYGDQRDSRTHATHTTQSVDDQPFAEQFHIRARRIRWLTCLKTSHSWQQSNWGCQVISKFRQDFPYVSFQLPFAL